jgi:hypothetical protein
MQTPSSEDSVTWHILSVVVRVADVQGGFNLRQFHDWIAFEKTWLQTDLIAKEGVQAAAHARRSFNRSLSSNPAITPVESTKPTKAFSKLSLIVLLKVDHISFVCFLGQSVGKTALTIHGLASRLRSVPFDSKAIRLAFDSMEMKFGPTGKLTGLVTLEGTSLQTLARDVTPSDKALKGDLVSMQFHFGRLTGTLDSDHRRLIILNNDPFLISIVDDWSLTKAADEPTLGVSFSVKMGQLKVAMTSNTAPTFMLLFQEVQDVVTQARSRATGQSPVSQPKKPGDRFHLDVAPRSYDKGSPNKIAIVRNMHFESKQFLVVAFLRNFSNPEAWQIKTSTIKASLTVSGDADSIHRKVSLDILPVNIDKLTLRSVTPSEETSMTAEQWVQAIEAARRASLTQIPAGHGQQESWQRQQTLEYKSDVRFVGDLDLSYSAQSYMNLWNVRALCLVFSPEFIGYAGWQSLCCGRAGSAVGSTAC